VALFAKRSSLHPGTRYIARGLNAAASPGNEVECEQLVWAIPAGSHNGSASELSSCIEGSTKWSSYVWRRGTVPIWWSQEIKSTVGEAEISVAKDGPYVGTTDYFKRLEGQYSARDVGPRTIINCVNLLRCAMGKPELLLSEHFHEAVRNVRKEIGLPVQVLNFDWHANNKALGHEKMVEGFWASVFPWLHEMGFSVGETKHQEGSVSSSSVSQWQRGLLRYNCADSLDRTNLASYFVAVQIMLRQCRMLGIKVEIEEAALALGLRSAGMMRSPSSSVVFKPVLPEGWESRVDPVTGKEFYIDHNTKTTSWVAPPPPPSTLVTPPPSPAAASTDLRWETQYALVDTCKEVLLPAAVMALSELFHANGDLQATCYTGTRAMHADLIDLLHPGKPQRTRPSAASTASNLGITIQRRYTNIVSDGHRQQQIETFLGMHLVKTFPGPCSRMLIESVSSNGFAGLLKPIPHVDENLRCDARCLLISPSSATARGILWPLPPGSNSADFLIKVIFTIHCLFTQVIIHSLSKYGSFVIAVISAVPSPATDILHSSRRVRRHLPKDV
jgi:hypothetical protein